MEGDRARVPEALASARRLADRQYARRLRIVVVLAQLPGDLREAVALATELDEAEAVRIAFRLGIQIRQLVVLLVGHHHVLRALVGPRVVGEAAVVARSTNPVPDSASAASPSATNDPAADRHAAPATNSTTG